MIRGLIVKSEKILIPIIILMDNENINQAIKLYPNNQIVEESFMHPNNQIYAPKCL
jgi:hypothetical protein